MTEAFQEFCNKKDLVGAHTAHLAVSLFVEEVERRRLIITGSNRFTFQDLFDAYHEVVLEFGLERKP